MTPLSPEPAFDRNVSLRTADGDEDFLRELADLFLAKCPAWAAELERAVRDRDPAALKRQGHLLTWTASRFGARPVVAAAHRLELMGVTGNLTEAEAAWADLSAALANLVSAFRDLTRSDCGPQGDRQ